MKTYQFIFELGDNVAQAWVKIVEQRSDWQGLVEGGAKVEHIMTTGSPSFVNLTIPADMEPDKFILGYPFRQIDNPAANGEPPSHPIG